MFDSLSFENTVEVYQPTETYTPGDGYNTEYPDSPTATIDGALDAPTSSADADAGGTTEAVDLTVYIDETVNISWNDAGDSGESETGIKVSGVKYTVDDIDEQHDGLLKLDCVEVDTWG